MFVVVDVMFVTGHHI